ncbi:MAG: hypothetical protein HC890_14845 [Chloroflexaceae bacterium]|nr:hypothetical protein [Chloroflexaceae bacterium]
MVETILRSPSERQGESGGVIAERQEWRQYLSVKDFSQGIVYRISTVSACLPVSKKRYPRSIGSGGGDRGWEQRGGKAITVEGKQWKRGGDREGARGKRAIATEQGLG